MKDSPTLPVPAEEPERYRFSVEDYHALARSGILSREDRIELFEGELILMPPISPDHSSSSRSLTQILRKLVPDSLLLCVAEPVTLSKNSEPQPDFSIVHSRADFYQSSHPSAADVLLLIEVSHSSAAFDTGAKARNYGKAGVPEYWVIDRPSHCLRLYSEPNPHGYRTVRTLFAGDQVQCAAVPEIRFAVTEVLVGA